MRKEIGEPWLQKEGNTHREEAIEQLLEEYDPSELDDVVKACPFYKPEEREFTSAYLDFHEYAKVGILTRLRIELEGLEVFGEEKTETGRVDGSVHSVRLKDDTVFLYNGDKPTEKIALIEVKTGGIKPLQAAAYSYTEQTPTIIAEVKRGSCHLVDLETAEKLLSYAVEQVKTLERLEEKNLRIPDHYRCSSCANKLCKHWSGTDSDPETRFVIKNRTNQLAENLSDTLEELVEIVENLLKERGFSTLR